MVLSYTQFSWTWPTYYNINVISSKGVYRIYYFLSEKKIQTMFKNFIWVSEN